MFSYYLLKAISKICCILPRGVCEVIGRGLGNFAWIFVPKRRKELARSQIKMCLGVSDEEAARLAKASAVRFGPMLMEVLRFPVIRRHIDDYVRIEGLDKLQKGLALGKGCIIAAAHSGNWELMGGAFAQAGIPLVGVAMKQRSGAADRFINEYRTLIGMHITYKSGVREMFDMLRKGWAIGLIMDQDTSRHNGIILDFFGRPTNCVPGAASMARFQGVPIFPAFMHRDEHGFHTLIVGDPVFVEKTKDKREDIRRTTQILTKDIEEHVRKYPEEWFWLHDRWKSMRDD
ncbi:MULTISPECIES: lysophospholipid acyltransferase family protein [unclassified Mitsuokella]|uniref:lysophospholipid acyltransferase family protein n=1 Tax=unclassified Mitsuokella TaxID=2637239 RepID=UPI000E531517|nr:MULTISPECIES: lysophospholipid acyltransferase family protein [unclassified Mitsuokella]RGS73683.1 lipid A biosynthesis acyltransferase [Mitsuokella sp. AF21-1AC]RHM55294.1 lipid A biosynthesis acyltransferase [Mitsuokella sp. AF33-22]